MALPHIYPELSEKGRKGEMALVGLSKFPSALEPPQPSGKQNFIGAVI